MKRKFVLLFLVFFIITDCFSQKDTIPAHYPGGIAAWTRYVMKNLNNSGANNSKGIKGKYAVTVMFKVDKFGNVSHARALNDPGNGTALEAVRVILESGKWNPASVNGKLIEYESRQTVIVAKANNIHPSNSKTWDRFFKMAHFQNLKQADKDSLHAGAILANSLKQIDEEFNNKKQKIEMDSSLTRKDRISQLDNLSDQKSVRIKSVLTDPRYIKWGLWVAKLRKELAAHPKK